MHEPARFGVDQWINVGPYTLHYVEVGCGQPVILIPGSWSTYRVWNRLLPLLAGDYRLLALDYLGVGDSDKPRSGFRYTIQEQADLVAGMIVALKIQPAHLIGASYGGAIVLNLAARYPDLVNKVVSIEGGILSDKMPSNPLEKLLKYPLLGDLLIGVTRTGILNKILLKLIAGKWYSLMTEKDRREMAEQIRHNASSAARIPWYWISVSPRTCQDFTEIAKTIRCPVLYLYGSQSDFSDILLKDNIEFIKTHLPQAQIIEIEGGIHDLQFQKPQETAPRIVEFLCT